MTYLTDDLTHIINHTKWNEFINKKIFLTGGTGFIGTWLLEAFAFANKLFNLNLSITVLTRDPQTFAKKAPHLAENSMIQFWVGDIKRFTFPTENFTHVIHAATEASKQLNDNEPHTMMDTIVKGTERILKFSKKINAEKLLLLSSGAIYGKQPGTLLQIPENYFSFPDIHSAYSLGKFMAENLVRAFAKKSTTQVKIARCFAFVGPYLPLDIHFAIGNFIQDGLLKKNIQIKSDGTSIRSYQYAADLVIWLLTILSEGKHGHAYNVGSDAALSIKDLAETVAKQFSSPPSIMIAKKSDEHFLPERYVPSIKKAQQELGLNNHIPLEQAIQKTIAWHQRKYS